MQRYFLPADSFTDERVTITGEDFHHITRVMRMEPGETVLAVNPEGQTALVSIEEITNDTVGAAVLEWKREETELPVRVTIASGLPKGDKLEYIVQKGTELGAFSFLPYTASRSVVKWDDKKAGKKRDRLQKIAKEAAEQAHRSVIPAVSAPVSFQALLDQAGEYDFKLAAFEESAREGETSALAAVLHKASPGDSILFVFGPEGGISAREMELLLQSGFTACGLGPRILRTETAPLYALAAVSYQSELLR